MSTSANILSLWDTLIWANAGILAVTPNVFRYDVLAKTEGSSEVTQLIDPSTSQINFFQIICTRVRNTAELRGQLQASRYVFDVEVSYYIEKDVSEASTNFNVAWAKIELLDDTVLTVLGKTWGGTISYYEQSGILKPKLINVDEKDVWQAGVSYTAVNTI